MKSEGLKASISVIKDLVQAHDRLRKAVKTQALGDHDACIVDCARLVTDIMNLLYVVIHLKLSPFERDKAEETLRRKSRNTIPDESFGLGKWINMFEEVHLFDKVGNELNKKFEWFTRSKLSELVELRRRIEHKRLELHQADIEESKKALTIASNILNELFGTYLDIESDLQRLADANKKDELELLHSRVLAVIASEPKFRIDNAEEGYYMIADCTMLGAFLERRQEQLHVFVMVHISIEECAEEKLEFLYSLAETEVLERIVASVPNLKPKDIRVLLYDNPRDVVKGAIFDVD